MKKMVKTAAVLAALLAMTNFIACSSDDSTSTDGDAGTATTNANTYWVIDDIIDSQDGISMTIKAGMYIHLEDDSKGTLYVANMEGALKGADPSKFPVTVSYTDEPQTQAFTYTVDGNKITITVTYRDENGQDKTEISEATLASDGKSFSMEEDGKTVTYKKADSAPENAVIGVTVDTAEKVLDVVYDLTTGLPKDFPNEDTLVDSSWTAPAATPATNDITWAWVATTNRKVKNNSGLQVSNGTAAEDIITLSAESDFTVTVTYKFAGAYDEAKVRTITVGDKSDSMTGSTDKDQTYTLISSAAKSVTIALNGMKITKIETKAAE